MVAKNTRTTETLRCKRSASKINGHHQPKKFEPIGETAKKNFRDVSLRANVVVQKVRVGHQERQQGHVGVGRQPGDAVPFYLEFLIDDSSKKETKPNLTR